MVYNFTLDEAGDALALCVVNATQAPGCIDTSRPLNDQKAGDQLRIVTTLMNAPNWPGIDAARKLLGRVHINTAAKLDDDAVACANCDWKGSATQCDPYRDFWSRVEVGEIIPHGDCPECGAFCYAQERPTPACVDVTQNPELAAVHPDVAWMLTLAVQFIDDWQDDDGKDKQSAAECTRAREAHTRAVNYLASLKQAAPAAGIEPS